MSQVYGPPEILELHPALSVQQLQRAVEQAAGFVGKELFLMWRIAGKQAPPSGPTTSSSAGTRDSFVASTSRPATPIPQQVQPSDWYIWKVKVVSSVMTGNQVTAINIFAAAGQPFNLQDSTVPVPRPPLANGDQVEYGYIGLGVLKNVPNADLLATRSIDEWAAEKKLSADILTKMKNNGVNKVSLLPRLAAHIDSLGLNVGEKIALLEALDEEEAEPTSSPTASSKAATGAQQLLERACELLEKTRQSGNRQGGVANAQEEVSVQVNREFDPRRLLSYARILNGEKMEEHTFLNLVAVLKSSFGVTKGYRGTNWADFEKTLKIMRDTRGWWKNVPLVTDAQEKLWTLKSGIAAEDEGVSFLDLNKQFHLILAGLTEEQILRTDWHTLHAELVQKMTRGGRGRGRGRGGGGGGRGRRNFGNRNHDDRHDEPAQSATTTTSATSASLTGPLPPSVAPRGQGGARSRPQL